MQDNDHEWDDEKASANLLKHGVSFEIATGVFKDPFALELLDDRGKYDEVRLITLGMVDGVVLYVVSTERNGRLRLISARRATRQEQDGYFTQDR